MSKKYQLDPENARHHGETNRRLISASLAELGAGRSILVDGEGIVRAGNATYQAAIEAGFEIVEVETKPNQLIAVKRADLVGRAAVRMGLVDNQAGDQSNFDPEAVLALAEKYGDEITDGIFDPGEIEEITQAAGIEFAKGDNTINRRATVEKQKQIRPVLSADDVSQFEQALRLTGQPNRAQALMTVCAEYIKAHADEV